MGSDQGPFMVFIAGWPWDGVGSSSAPMTQSAFFLCASLLPIESQNICVFVKVCVLDWGGLGGGYTHLRAVFYGHHL